MDLDKLKRETKILVEKFFEGKICGAYSPSKQAELQRDGGTNYDTMKTDIQAFETDRDAVLAEIDALVDTSVYDDMSGSIPGSDADMMAYVATKMTLSNDDQKLSMAYALIDVDKQ